MHLDDEQVQRLLHDELAPPMTTMVREHVAGCGACRARVNAAVSEEDAVFALLARLDHPVPPVRVQTVLARERRRRGGALRWAAGMLLVIGLAGVAYAAPGSPVRRWLDDLAQRAPGRSDRAPFPANETSIPAFGGIAVTPGESLVIAFDLTAGNGSVRVSLTDGAEVVVRAPSGAAEYTAGESRIQVTPRSDAATYDVEVPRTAARVEIRVGSERKFLKSGSNVLGMSNFSLRPQ